MFQFSLCETELCTEKFILQIWKLYKKKPKSTKHKITFALLMNNFLFFSSHEAALFTHTDLKYMKLSIV